MNNVFVYNESECHRSRRQLQSPPIARDTAARGLVNTFEGPCRQCTVGFHMPDQDSKIQTAKPSPRRKKNIDKPRIRAPQPFTDRRRLSEPVGVGAEQQLAVTALEVASEEKNETKGWLPSRHNFGRRLGSAFMSFLLHVTVLVILACLTIPTLVRERLPILLSDVNLADDEKLDESLVDSPQDYTIATLSPSTAAATQASANTASGGLNQLNESIASDVRSSVDAEASISSSARSAIGLPSIGELSTHLSGALKGEGRAVVDNYGQAFDQLTQEILMMLEQSRVLVVWCFDQSASMKDDQQEIRDRIERVYEELGLADIADHGNLVTGVTSFGQNFLVHLEKPTSRLEEIKSAIDEIPVDPSGKEFTCLSVAHSIEQYREFAKRTRRQMALILVSDESGNREDNEAHLEATIDLAKDARCRIYVLGREAVFGYPFAYFRWEHPQTYVVHYLQVDRGPESSVVEQLQTDGFKKRVDSHPSGFGPYEQSRMAWETDGIFFMLPSIESDVIDYDQRRYRLENMRAYQPDLRPRVKLLAEISNSTLRSGLLKIIYDMNPYDTEAAQIIVMRTRFSTKIFKFIEQVRTEQTKIVIYMDYLDRMRTALEEVWALRDKETAPRWRANADLMRAQLLAYKIRLYEYGSYLEAFMNDPKILPLTKDPDLYFIHWQVARRQEMITGDVTKQYVEEAKQLFAAVIENHPETPWAGRAEKEMSSGFGVELRSYYWRRPKPGDGPPVELIPIPKL